MRPFPPEVISQVIDITARFPAMHGAPIHVGDPTEIGIDDLMAPDFGDAVRMGADELPVFWACGVTPQAVAIEARPSLAIFHAPGHMFITDRPHAEFDSQEKAS